jgi:hypothetical protein
MRFGRVEKPCAQSALLKKFGFIRFREGHDFSRAATTHQIAALAAGQTPITPKTKRPARLSAGRSGGLFGIDQEVVTLKSVTTSANSGFFHSKHRRDLYAGRFQSYSPVELRRFLERPP